MKWFKNLSIMKKLVMSFIIVAVFSGIVGMIGIRSIRSISGADMMLYQRATLSIMHVGTIAKSYQEMRVNLREILLYPDTKMIIQRRENVDRINGHVVDALKKYEEARRFGNITDEKADAEYKELSEAYTDVYNLVIKIAVTMQEGRRQEAVDYLALPATIAVVKRMDNAINSVVSYNQQNAMVLAEQNSKDATRAILTMYITIVVTMFLAIMLGYLIAMLIKNPTNKCLVFAQKIAAGDFTERIEIDQQDEIGKLGEALNTAADDLEKMVSDSIVGSQNLVQAIQEISAGNENLSQRTSEQASSLEEIASTIEETTASINQNAENSKTANDISIKTSSLAEEGGRVVFEAANAINEINDASKKIEEITGVINEIAFQTNLLALNAAVEAARAGEQGRGFAVVAGEVRNLAQRSGNAAKEIGELIKSTIIKVNKGTSLANQSGEALNDTIVSVKNVSRFVAEIAAASEEQRQGAAQINIAVSELDSMTQQNAGLVEETASASEEIANQAQELLAIMERFKIRASMKKSITEMKHKELHLAAAEQRKPAVKKVGYQKTAPAEKKNEPGKIEKILSDEGFEQF